MLNAQRTALYILLAFALALASVSITRKLHKPNVKQKATPNSNGKNANVQRQTPISAGSFPCVRLVLGLSARHAIRGVLAR
jgi:hypothetical protein